MGDRKHCPQCGWLWDGKSDICPPCQTENNSVKHQVVFTFKSEDEKNHFIGQLSDGWGENYVSLSPLNDKSFYKATEFSVRLYDVEIDFDEDTE